MLLILQAHLKCCLLYRAGGTTPATPAMAGVKFRQLRLVPRLEFPPGTSLCAPRALLRERWQAVPAPAVAYLSLAIVLINLHHPSSFRNESFGYAKPVYRTVQPAWFQKWPWLHYDQVGDRMFCYTCVQAYQQGLTLA